MKAERRKTLFIFKVYFISQNAVPLGAQDKTCPLYPSTHIRLPKIPQIHAYSPILFTL